MRRKRIIVDMDDVLYPLLDIWLNTYNRIYDDNLTAEDINDWDVSKFVKKECGKSVYGLLKPVDGVSLWDKGLPVEYSVDALRRINKYMDIFVVSSVTGDYSICKYKEQWLLKHFPFLDNKNFYFVTNKSAVSGSYMVDDYYKNMENFDGVRILFPRPHNRHIVPEYPHERVVDWLEVEKIIEKTV